MIKYSNFIGLARRIALKLQHNGFNLRYVRSPLDEVMLMLRRVRSASLIALSA